MNKDYIPTWEESKPIENEKVPTWEESSPVKSAAYLEEPSKSNVLQNIASGTSDLLVSAGQGLTFGFGDELLAAVNALAEGDPSKYREFQQKYQKEYEQLQERSPLLSTLGEIAGGIVVPGGLAAKGLAKGATLGQKLRQAVAAGAATGAISGVGGSKEYIDPENLYKSSTELLSEAGKGAAIGGGIGAGFGLAGKALQGLGRMAGQKSEAVKKAYELSRKGMPAGSDEGAEDIIARQRITTKDVVDDILKPLETTKKQYNEAIAQTADIEIKPILNKEDDFGEFLTIHDSNGNEINIKPHESFIKLKHTVEDFPEIRKVDKNIYKKIINNEPVTFSELLEFRKNLVKDYDTNLNKLNRGDINKIYGSKFNVEAGEMEIPGAIQNIDDIISDFIPQNEQYKAAIKKAAELPEQILSKNADPMAQHVKAYNLEPETIRNRLEAVLKRKIEMSGGFSSASVNARVDIKDLLNSVDEANRVIRENLKRQNPLINESEIEKSLIKKDVMGEKIKESATETSVLNSILGIRSNQAQDFGGELKAAFAGKNILGMPIIDAASQVGSVARAIEPVTKPIGKVVTAPFMPIEKFSNILKQNKSEHLQRLGAQLEEASKNKKSAATAAALNSLMQSSSARNALNLEPGQTWFSED